MDDLGEIVRADHRVGQHDLTAGGRAGIEQIVLRAGGRAQRGDQFLADRVQRRIRHLGEQLGEVIEDQPGPVRQHGHRGIGAHRADRLRAGPGHRPEDDPQFLLGVPEQLLPDGELAAAGQFPVPVGQVVEVQQPGVQPVLVRMLGGQLGLDLFVFDDPAGRGVGQEDPAGLQPALPDHLGRVDVQHADLAGQHHQAVPGHPVPAGPQPVAVQDRADHVAVGEGDQGRAVPRFHQGGVEPVERPPRRIHLLVVLPRLGDHHQHGVRQRPAAQVQQFQARVEARRVTRRLIEDRQQPVEAAAGRVRLDQAGGQHRLPGPHPVSVAPDGVDLAVVRDEPERVGQRPGREGVGREPGVHQGQRGPEPGVGQVRVERLQLQRREHALVDDRGPGQAGEVRAGLGFGALAQAERPAVQLRSAFPGPGHEQLHQPRQHRPGTSAAPVWLMRDIPPAEDRQPLIAGQPLDGRHRRGVFSVAGQEHQPGRVTARLRQGEVADRTEERVRDLGDDACPVASLRIGALGTAMIQVTQHAQRLGHDVVVPAAGQIRDKTDTARIMLKAAVVKSLRAV